MISWGPSVRPLHDPAEDGGLSGLAERGFGITLDGLVPAERDERDLDPFDLGSEQDRFDA